MEKPEILQTNTILKNRQEKKNQQKKKNAGISKLPHPKIPAKNTQSVLFCVD